MPVCQCWPLWPLDPDNAKVSVRPCLCSLAIPLWKGAVILRGCSCKSIKTKTARQHRRQDFTSTTITSILIKWKLQKENNSQSNFLDVKDIQNKTEVGKLNLRVCTYYSRLNQIFNKRYPTFLRRHCFLSSFKILRNCSSNAVLYVSW